MRRLFLLASVGLPVAFGLLWSAGVVHPSISVSITPVGEAEVAITRITDGHGRTDVVKLGTSKHLTVRAGEVLDVVIQGNSAQVHVSAETRLLIPLVRVSGSGTHVQLVTSPSLRIRTGSRLSALAHRELK